MIPWLVDIGDRSELELWLAESFSKNSAAVVMMVRGDGPVVRQFIPNALDAAKLHPSRVVVWVKDPALMSDQVVSDLYGKSDEILAAVVGRTGILCGWVTEDRIQVEDAAFAFAEAEDEGA